MNPYTTDQEIVMTPSELADLKADAEKARAEAVQILAAVLALRAASPRLDEHSLREAITRLEARTHAIDEETKDLQFVADLFLPAEAPGGSA